MFSQNIGYQAGISQADLSMMMTYDDNNMITKGTDMVTIKSKL